MARPLRIQFEGAIYHVTVRGNARQAIFLNEADQRRFLKNLGECVLDYCVRLYLFCLMPNHFHLLVETPKANISAFMGSLLTGYTVYFNRRHRRVGHLTQGRFGARLVEGNEYLLKLSRYVHLNPVYRAPVRSEPLEVRLSVLQEYWASSYPGYVGLAPRHPFVTYEPILALVSGGGPSPEQAYRAFVEGGLAESDEEFVALLRRRGEGIGTEPFRSRVQGMYLSRVDGSVRKEDAAFRSRGPKVPAVQVVERVQAELGHEGRWGCWERALLAHLLCRHAGVSQREAAAYVGVTTGAAVSLQISRLREAMATDAELRQKVNEIELQLGVSP